MREVRVADIEAEIARSVDAADGGRPVEQEALIVLLIPRGSPFEMYAGAIAPGIVASQGRAGVVRIDTTAEPAAPARFGLSGSPGVVIFVNGKQVAAFAVPFAGALGPMIGPALQRMIEGVTKTLPPPP